MPARARPAAARTRRTSGATAESAVKAAAPQAASRSRKTPAATAATSPGAGTPRADQRAPKPRAPAAAPGFAPVARIARDLRALTGTVLGMAGSAADLSLALARSRLRDPKAQQAVESAGQALRKARQAAGVTTQELGAAIDLSDPDLLEQAEKGKIALPFEVILRLAAVLGRNDPVTFALRLMRSYRPDLWQALDDAGVGRLVVQAGRERELANLYRANDAARRLSDAQFARVLRFTEAAFEMAVALHTDATRARKG
jgi:transcriptional regulator with XRE-family HTH domain